MAFEFDLEQFQKQIESCASVQEVWKLSDKIFSDTLNLISSMKISNKQKDLLSDYLIANRHAVRKG